MGVFVTGEPLGPGVNSTPVGGALGDNVGFDVVGDNVGSDVVGAAQLGSPTHSKSSHAQSLHNLRYVPSLHRGLASIRRPPLKRRSHG